MYYSFVALVTQLDGRPTCFIKDSLPDVFVHVGLTIHHTAINKNDGMHVSHLSDINKEGFKVHLQLDEKLLEFDCLRESHSGRIYRYSAFLKNHKSLRHL